MPDLTCEAARAALSARLDGASDADTDDVDAHLERCGQCRRFEAGIRSLRQQLRYEPVGTVPDVAPAVRRRVTSEGGGADADADAEELMGADGSARAARRRGGRLLAVAAAVAVGALVGALLVGDRGTEPGPSAAASVPREVVAAQYQLSGVDADLELVERGWHREVPERRWSGRLTWSAPETLSLELRDRTDYPSDEWARNDVFLVVDGERRTALGPRDCPAEGQPDCTADRPEALVTIGREPFADGAPVPLDLVLPVASFAGAAEPARLGERTIAGREATGLRTTAAQVQPVLDGLRPAGNLRQVHPADPVELWLDAETMTPLSLTVRAGDAPGRTTWATNRGYVDRPDDEILELAVTAVRYDVAVPDTDTDTEGAGAEVTERDAGFRDGPVPTLLTAARLPLGFELHRTGSTSGPGPSVDVASWTDGRAWIKLRTTPGWPGGRLFGDLGPVVREEPLHSGGVAYVNDRGDRIAVHTEFLDVVVIGSVDESLLLAVASSLGLRGEPLPPDWEQAATADRTAAVAALPGLLLPRELPGFGAPALRIDEGTVTAQYAGAGARTFTVVESAGERLSPPLDASVIGVEVRGGKGRWSDARQELEWVEGGVVVSLRSPTLGLNELLSVAESMVPA